jgi:hypothetical protein
VYFDRSSNQALLETPRNGFKKTQKQFLENRVAKGGRTISYQGQKDK